MIYFDAAWVDYWAVDFNYESRKEMIKVPKGAGVNTRATCQARSRPSGNSSCRPPTSRSAGPARTFSRTSGKASALARGGPWI